MKCPCCKQEFWEMPKREKMVCLNCGTEVEFEYKSVIVPRIQCIH